MHYIAEADNHGLFEVRFYRLDHLNDRSGLDYRTRTRELPGNTAAAREAALYFEKFASLSTYYNEVNKICYNVCPAFYKFKIAPFQSLFERYDRLPMEAGIDNASNSDDLERDLSSR